MPIRTIIGCVAPVLVLITGLHPSLADTLYLKDGRVLKDVQIVTQGAASIGYVESEGGAAQSLAKGL